MSAKIIRLLLVILSCGIMAYYIPDFYQKRVEKKSSKTLMYYSEITKKILIAKEQKDSVTEKYSMVYYNSDQQKMSETDYMRQLPFNNKRKLKLMNMLPDSIDGIAFDKKALKSCFRSMLICDKSYNLGLNPMFESETGKNGLHFPEDLFRINTNGIEFIDYTSNKINKEKSELFNKALLSQGFQAPAQSIYGIPSTIKSKDDGYFLVDKQGNLFHLMMVNGQPACQQIPFEGKIKNLKCHSSGDILCHIIDSENHLYAMKRTDQKIYRLKTEPVEHMVFLSSNCFARSYKLLHKGKSTLYVFDNNFNPIVEHTELSEEYRNSKEGKQEQKLFPFRIKRTPGLVHFYPIVNPIKDFYLTNLICLGFYIICSFFFKGRVRRLPMVVNCLLVAVFGIYGLLSIAIFPSAK